MKFKIFTFILGMGLALSSVVAAPKVLDGYVTDEAGVLNPTQIKRMAAVSSELQQKTGIQLATFVTRSLGGQPIESVAQAVFKASGIGDSQKDQGVLFVIAPNERKVRIEVGYGVEGDLPDGRAGQLIDTQVLPFFKQRQMAAGVESGHWAIAQHLAAQRGVTLNGSVTSQPKPKNGISLIGLVLIIALFLLISRGGGGLLPWVILGGMGNNDRWGGGGFGGGGFGGFGGGMSGGGGASRGW